MLVFPIHPHIRVVGELLPQGHDLQWRRRVRLYMEIPQGWPVPEDYLDRLEDGLVCLNGDFRILLGKMIWEDRNKAWRQISSFFMRVQEIYWNDLFSHGVILAKSSLEINENLYEDPLHMYSVAVRILVPKFMPHKAPGSVGTQTWLSEIYGTGSTKYYPKEPLSFDNYDDFLVGFTSEYCHSHLAYVDDFETIRKAIADCLCSDS